MLMQHIYNQHIAALNPLLKERISGVF